MTGARAGLRSGWSSAAVIAVGFIVAGCSKPSPPSKPAVRISAARQFVLELLSTVRRADRNAWMEMLSSEQRSRFTGAETDSAALQIQMEGWKRDLERVEPFLRTSPVRVETDSAGGDLIVFGTPEDDNRVVVTVVREGGAFKLDEN